MDVEGRAPARVVTRLESLQLSEGNQLRGRTWAQLRAKFGEAVVS